MTFSRTLYGIPSNPNAHLSDFSAAIHKINADISSKRCSNVKEINAFAFGTQVSISIAYINGTKTSVCIPDGHELFRQKGYDVLYTRVFQLLYDEDIVNYW